MTVQGAGARVTDCCELTDCAACFLYGVCALLQAVTTASPAASNPSPLEQQLKGGGPAAEGRGKEDRQSGEGN